MTTPIKILRNRGLRPRKHLGQCFLQDQNITRKIVDFADIRPDETVVEIGAGLGIMTGMMAEKARRVIALEIDPAMIQILKERFRGNGNVVVVETDVLKYDFFSTCSADVSEKLKIMGNIPYGISSPILFRLMDFRKRIASMVLMMQKDVVDRVSALPGTKNYGIPSVAFSMFFRTERLTDVPASCFYPEPKVVSSILKMETREKPLVDLVDEALFFRIVRLAFAKRRKTLANNLRYANLVDYTIEEMLSAMDASGIDGRRRAETLDAKEFGLLTNIFATEKRT